MFLMALLVSCNDKISNLETAKAYYDVLNKSDYSKVPLLFLDSILSKEGDYKKVFSQPDYIEFLKWDAVFKSEHKLLEIKEKEGVVFAMVSQNDKRIMFLNEEPIITNQVIRFKNGKISSVEIIDYVVFNEKTFVKNRAKLLNWINENHPELNDFLYDQTESGGLNYIKAIDLFKETN